MVPLLIVACVLLATALALVSWLVVVIVAEIPYATDNFGVE